MSDMSMRRWLLFGVRYIRLLNCFTKTLSKTFTADSCFSPRVRAQSCLTLCDPMDCSPPGFSVHGISQARILEQVAISFSRGSSRLSDQTLISYIPGRFFTTEPPGRTNALALWVAN